MTASRVEKACFRLALVLAVALPAWFRYAEFIDRRHLQEANVFAQTEQGRSEERFNYQLRREEALFDAVRQDRTAAYAAPVLALLAFYVLRWVLVGRLHPLWPLRRTQPTPEQ